MSMYTSPSSLSFFFLCVKTKLFKNRIKSEQMKKKCVKNLKNSWKTYGAVFPTLSICLCVYLHFLNSNKDKKAF